jgi:hypothetical protein
MATWPAWAPPLWQLAQVDSPGALELFSGGLGLNAQTTIGMTHTLTMNATKYPLFFLDLIGITSWVLKG